LAASKTLTEKQRILRARKAANTRWSNPAARGSHVDRRLEHFADQIDPAHILPEPERTNLAKQRRRAYMQGLALASSRIRATRKAGAVDAT
jgi:hypothetical protein